MYLPGRHFQPKELRPPTFSLCQLEEHQMLIVTLPAPVLCPFSAKPVATFNRPACHRQGGRMKVVTATRGPKMATRPLHPPHPPFPSLFSSLSPCDEAPSPLCQNCSPSRSDVREGEGEESPTGPRARAHPARSCPATQPSQELRLLTRKPPLPLPPPLQVPKKGGREGEGESLREMCHLSPADDGTVTVTVAGVSCFNSKLKRLA
jgi:hypothetical protein